MGKLTWQFHTIFFNFSLKLCFRDAQATNSACRKLAVSLADSINLRTILSLLYTMTQVLRAHTDSHLREAFQNELSKFTTVVRNSLSKNDSKCRIWIFEFWHFPPIFVLFKTDLSGNTVWPQASGFQNPPKWTIFGIFN